jgi:hypothetical protein
VEHPWLNRKDFLALVRSMDFGMQTSLSETFNICAADFASEGVPIVVSDQIPWAHRLFVAAATSSADIVSRLAMLARFRSFGIAYLNRLSLARYVRDAEERWLKFANPQLA